MPRVRVYQSSEDTNFQQAMWIDGDKGGMITSQDKVEQDSRTESVKARITTETEWTQ